MTKASKPAAEASEKDRRGQRQGGMRALAAALPAISGRALGRRGFGEAGIVTDWAAIVGETLAGQSLPLKLSFPPGRREEGVLLVRVAGPLAIELQHLAPLVLERVNAYLGYRAVTQLRLRQGPLPERPRPPPEEAALPPLAEAELRRQTAAVEDPALREALEGLGRALRQAGPGTK
jgi:hypothetical protein